jgi:hypothetical protein
MARQQSDLVALYVAMPRGIRSFLDIHRACVDAAISAGALAAAGRDLLDRTRGNVATDVERAVIRIGMDGSDDGRIALAWLRASNVPLRELKNIGISARLESSAAAIDALDQLIQILSQDGAHTVMLLLDEVQELQDLGRKRPEAVGGLHKLFDRHPQGMTMVLSFTTGSQATMRAIIDAPLSDRAAETITLPALSVGEAVDFVTELVRHFSVDPEKAPFPLQPSAIEMVMEELSRRLPELTPRAITRAFDRILREADLDIADGHITEIDADYALAHLPQDPTDAEATSG